MRPDLWSDVKATVTARTRQQFQVAQRAFEPIKRAVTEELQDKSAAWQTVSERPRAAAQAVYEDLSTAYTKLYRAFYRAYRGNEFYLKDVCDAVSDAYQAARVKTIQMSRKIQAVMGPKIAHMKIQLEELSLQMSKMAEEVSQQLAEKRRETRQKMRAMYAEYRPQLDQAMGKVRGAYKQAKDTVMGAYNQVINTPYDNCCSTSAFYCDLMLNYCFSGYNLSSRRSVTSKPKGHSLYIGSIIKDCYTTRSSTTPASSKSPTLSMTSSPPTSSRRSASSSTAPAMPGTSGWRSIRPLSTPSRTCGTTSPSARRSATWPSSSRPRLRG